MKMKKTTRNLLTGICTSIVVFLMYIGYCCFRHKTIRENFILSVVIYFVVYIVTSIILIKFEKRD